MNVPFKLSMLLTAFLLFPSLMKAQEEEPMTKERHVAILSAYKIFADARKDAEKIAKASEVPFSMEDRVYDEKRGLIYPDDFDDEVYAGGYVARRYDMTHVADGDTQTAFLSVEKSDAYDGFTPGYYIVVAGIQESRESALKQIAKFKKWAPTAYVKKTKIYLGCLR
ncbi:hypothetical protein ACFQY0_11475 [Haloferula chungangensis]|uniref:SPOR domain-containing protein n=1 Tax=Haloferula chungangensis TaxID=1048331 RepID=A0ABW2L5Z8_9BACT